MWSPTFRLSTPSPTCDDGPGALVAEHRGEGERERAVRDREVRVADAGGAELDADLTRLRVREVEVHDLERLPDCGGDGGLRHSGSPWTRLLRDVRSRAI